MGLTFCLLPVHVISLQNFTPASTTAISATCLHAYDFDSVSLKQLVTKKGNFRRILRT